VKIKMAGSLSKGLHPAAQPGKRGNYIREMSFSAFNGKGKQKWI